jgi:GNAT superfamily N-acetyltransferase
MSCTPARGSTGRSCRPAAAAEFASPGGAFLVGCRDGEPVCCGGLRRLDDQTCELVRMYVAPGLRGQGLARRMLVALEDAARDRGYAVARLDTGPRQTGAMALYRSSGYREIDDYSGHATAAFWAEKPL